MNELNALRSKFDAQQRGILTDIWRYYLKDGHWMPIRFLHVTHGAECVNDLRQPFQKISVDSLSSCRSKVLLSSGKVVGGLIQTAEGSWAGREGPFTNRSGFLR